MDQVIAFDKSLQQRLQEFLDILSSENTILSASNLKKEWAFFLELSLDCSGWQAVWKIPRVTCELYSIVFPTIVLVYVEDVCFEDLNAFVKILAVQDDISLPDKHVVSLIQLWPTKAQDKSVVLNLQSTANALDMLRFFYHNLIMPWDFEDDDTSDWVSKHLESRLRLYYDMKNGIIPRTMSEHIRSLLVEARRKHTAREQLEKEIGNDDDIEVNGTDVEDDKVQRLMSLHVRITQIKNEIEILENPLMRKVVMKEQKELSRRADGVVKYWLVCEVSKVKEYVEFLKRVEQFYPNEKFNFTSDLPNTLIELVNNDMVILNRNKYILKSAAIFYNGGIIKGIYEKQDTIIVSHSEDLMFDISGEVTMENVTLHAIKPQCCIVIRRGKLILKNCNLVGNMDSSIHQGIIVLDGSRLEMIDCAITKFATAIVGNSGSHISMRNCEIHDVNFGMKIYENCFLSVQKTIFRNCREYGICVETDQDNIQNVGSFDVLKRISDITFDDLSGNNNAKGDAIINNGQRIIPVKDLFTNLDVTYCEKLNSRIKDEDMEVTTEGEGNDTIIEKTDVVESTSQNVP